MNRSAGTALRALVVAGTLCFMSGEALAIKVGICMPTQNEERWNNDGKTLKALLENKGYETDLFYGGDADVPIQQRQIPRLIREDCDILVIGAIDGTALAAQLEEAEQKNIPVISYDRLIMNSKAVSYYASFDNVKAGELQAQAIVDALKLNYDYTPKTIEFVCGSLDDNNTRMFWQGAMSILRPYLDAGLLQVPSGLNTLEQTATPGWSTDNALKQFSEVLAKVGYGRNGKKLDAIYSMADCLSLGVLTALNNAGITGQDLPYLTGQDATAKAINDIINGKQGMTVFKDTHLLSEVVADMVDAIALGQEVKVNDTSTYNNGAGVVKAYLCAPQAIDRSNYKKLLESGFITEEQLNDPHNQ
ncbi:MAG: sugar-binding protein [Succinivibrio sp.]|nr:sugar-binding protein [Succinivibrio sp.]